MIDAGQWSKIKVGISAAAPKREEVVVLIRIVSLLALLLSPGTAISANADVTKQLSEALLWARGDPAEAVYALVEAGNNFKNGYAAYGFGEGASYRAIVILDSPLKVGDATATAVISETENSNLDFGAFTYAKFTGDYRKIVTLLKLQPEESGVEFSMGKFVSRQQPSNRCPPIVVLTPSDEAPDQFLLGCGWCNGG
ncbi:MAG: hypothetical protein IPF83_08145 [Rhodanobacteraceae bacterium]|nr:hypothetical protein [Rhodanobacteraceae bacterium]